MKKCAKCGRQNDDGNMFCDSCGNVLSGESVSASSNNESTYTSPQSSGSQSKSKPKVKITVTAVIAIIIVVAAIGGVAFFIFNSFANDPTNFDDDGQIHTNDVKMWEMGKDSKMRYTKVGDVSGHYKLIVTESSDTKVDFRYQDHTKTGNSESTTYSDKSWNREYLKSLSSGPIMKDDEGNEFYRHVESNRILYVEKNSGIPYWIQYIDDNYTLVLAYCDLKPM